MNTLEIANKYVELCKQHQNEAIVKTLFSPGIVSVEAMEMPGGSKEVRGTAAVLEKGKQWMQNHEIHSAKVEGPWPNADRFVVRFHYDVTQKATGKRLTLDEVGLFTVEGGKIAREEFFYAM